MRRLMTTILTVLMTTIAIAQVQWSENKVSYSCDIATVAAKYNQTAHDVARQGGWVIIPASDVKSNGTTKGLLIYHHVFRDEYFAYDLECPHCKENGVVSKVYMKTNITCRCKCGAEFQNISQGSNQQTNMTNEGLFWLVQYNTLVRNGKLYVSHEDLYTKYASR